MYSFYYSEYYKNTSEKINFIVTPVGPVNYSKPNQISHIITLPIPIYYLTDEEQEILKSILILKFPYPYISPIPQDKHQEIKDRQNYLMDNIVRFGSFLPNQQTLLQIQDPTFSQHLDLKYNNISILQQPVGNILNVEKDIEHIYEDIVNTNKNENLSNYENILQQNQLENNQQPQQFSLNPHHNNKEKGFQYPSFYSYNNFRNHIVNLEHQQQPIQQQQPTQQQF